MCELKTQFFEQSFLHNKVIIQYHRLAESLNHTVEILTITNIKKYKQNIISEDLCMVKPFYERVIMNACSHYERFEVCRVSRSCLDHYDLMF